MMNILRSAVVALTVLVASSPVTAQTVPAVQQGTDTYQYWCATCHGAGPGHPGTTALAAKY